MRFDAQTHKKEKKEQKMCVSLSVSVWENKRKITKTNGTHLFSFQFQRLYAAAAVEQRNVNQYYSSGFLTCRFNFECDFFFFLSAHAPLESWCLNEGFFLLWLFLQRKIPLVWHYFVWRFTRELQSKSICLKCFDYFCVKQMKCTVLWTLFKRWIWWKSLTISGLSGECFF